jgi:dUTPase
MIEIALKRLPHGEGLPLPAYASDGAAGLDVVAAESLTLAPGARHAVATGFSIAIPDGYESRSARARALRSSTASPASTRRERSTAIIAAK